jgi:hypothetical protein
LIRIEVSIGIRSGINAGSCNYFKPDGWSERSMAKPVSLEELSILVRGSILFEVDFTDKLLGAYSL